MGVIDTIHEESTLRGKHGADVRQRLLFLAGMSTIQHANAIGEHEIESRGTGINRFDRCLHHAKGAIGNLVGTGSLGLSDALRGTIHHHHDVPGCDPVHHFSGSRTRRSADLEHTHSRLEWQGIDNGP